MPELHFTPTELAARWRRTLRIQVKTLANWRCKIPPRGPMFRRIGNKILYPLSAVLDYEATAGRPAQDLSVDADPHFKQPVSAKGATRLERADIEVLVAARGASAARIAHQQERLRRQALRLDRHFHHQLLRLQARVMEDACSGAEPEPPPATAANQRPPGET